MLEIRSATHTDIAALVAMDHIAAADPLRARVIEESIAAGHCLLAHQAGEVVGYAILNYSFFHCGFVELIYVRQDMRRQGVGRALLERIEHTCLTPKLFVSTNQSNTPMRSLLLSLGYIPSGQVDNLDEGDPELFYFKRLGQS